MTKRTVELMAWWATSISAVIAALALGAVLFEYKKAQAWKRAEFVAAEVKAFESQPSVRIVMQMLDWNERLVELHPGECNDRFVFVTDALLSKALVPHVEKANFDADEARIRDHFDVFFDGLERLEHAVQADLIEADDLAPYLGYWLEIIGNPAIDRKPVELLRTMWRYIDFYNFKGVKNLLRRFGYNVVLEETS